MFRFVKQIFVSAMVFYSCNPLKFVSLNNQKCKLRTQMININSNEPLFYTYSVKISKCGGSCNNINDPYVKTLLIPDVVKKINVKVSNLISRTNRTRHIEWHETC